MNNFALKTTLRQHNALKTNQFFQMVKLYLSLDSKRLKFISAQMISRNEKLKKNMILTFIYLFVLYIALIWVEICLQHYVIYTSKWIRIEILYINCIT
jgi:hypothetical protein